MNHGKTIKTGPFPVCRNIMVRLVVFSLFLSFALVQAIHGQSEHMWDFVKEQKEVTRPRALLSAQFFLLSQIKLYQLLLSEQQPDACNFSPSCSRFSYEAIQKRGPLVGALLTVDRLQRCNPWAWNYHGTYYGVTWVPGRGYKLLDPP
jgi:putative membrane protein insertion efficiency factor